MKPKYRIMLKSKKKLMRKRYFWWTVVCIQNGQIILTSETYTTNGARCKTINAFIDHFTEHIDVMTEKT